MVALFLKTPKLQPVGLELVQQFGPQGESPDFFDNDPLVIDFAHHSGDSSTEDLSALIQTLQSCHLKPLAFRNADFVQAIAANALGLVEAPAEVLRNKSATAEKIASANATETVKEVIKEVVIEVVREVVREVPALATLVIDKPLRSGQKIYARGADLVVLAMVNQGAEVVADGNIHVYAPLRGKAMAGASGNTQARIFSLCLEPELISIAGVYRTSEHPLAADVQGKPAQVRLSNDGQDKLLFEALNP